VKKVTLNSIKTIDCEIKKAKPGFILFSKRGKSAELTFWAH